MYDYAVAFIFILSFFCGVFVGKRLKPQDTQKPIGQLHIRTSEEAAEGYILFTSDFYTIVDSKQKTVVLKVVHDKGVPDISKLERKDIR